MVVNFNEKMYCVTFSGEKRMLMHWLTQSLHSAQAVTLAGIYKGHSIKCIYCSLLPGFFLL